MFVLTGRYSTAQHSAAQHSAAQRSTAQHSADLLCNVHKLAGHFIVLRVGTVELEMQTAAARVESQSEAKASDGKTLFQTLQCKFGSRSRLLASAYS